jgi:hypothetical protein
MGKIRGEIGGEITGTVGDVTITTWKGIKVAKRRRGPSTVPPSQAQMQQRNRFLLASTYAKAVVEEGEAQRAVEGQDFHWVYRTKTDFPNAQLGKPFRLLIEAEDLPGNIVTHTVDGEL